MAGEMPLKMLARALNNRILVKLKDGSEYVGTLYRYDPCMNLILLDAEEVSEGRLDPPIAKLGKIIIRGSNVLYVVLDLDKLHSE